MNRPVKQEYWFKRRRYGYGWSPTTWQGWVTILVFLAVIIMNSIVLATNPYSNELLWLYLNIVIIAVAALVIISATKGPSPKWRWGRKDDDSTN